MRPEDVGRQLCRLFVHVCSGHLLEILERVGDFSEDLSFVLSRAEASEVHVVGIAESDSQRAEVGKSHADLCVKLWWL